MRTPMLDDGGMGPSPRRRLIVGALLALLFGLVSWGGWWWTHPHLLADTSPLGNGRFHPLPVNQATVHVNVAQGPESDEVITLHSVTARFARNTAKATATFDICKARPGVTPIGSVGDSEPLGAYCSRILPITDGTRFHCTKAGREPTEYIVMTIRPSMPGIAIVDQVSFTDSRSWSHFGQRGTEHSDQYWSIRAT